MARLPGENWSGEASRSQGFAVEETRVDVTIGEGNDNESANAALRKERPIWMMESTVVSSEKSQVFLLVFARLYLKLCNIHADCPIKCFILII